MRKFFVNNENISNQIIKITGTDVNHIKNVLRLKKSDKLQICNQDTSENFLCEITSIEDDIVELEIIKKIDSDVESNVELDIIQGLPKADKMELIIQKGTELGVSNFIPIFLKRCIVKLSKKDEDKKLVRWQKIAEVAAKQSHRDIVPQIKNIISIQDLCSIINNYDVVLLAYENEKDNYLKNELQKITKSKEKIKIAVVIGPEGGLEEDEVQIIKDAGAKVISLGKRILRTETVALQVSSIIMYELENNGI